VVGLEDTCMALSGTAGDDDGTGAHGAGAFVFCGDSRHTVDGKKRVFLAKRFQQGLPLDPEGNRVAVLTRGLDGCLFLFPEFGLERALQRMNTEAFAPKDMRKLQRMFFSFSHRVSLDASGRLLLPEKLRKLAGIEKEVVAVGVMDRIELWAAERWDAFAAENEDAFDDLEDLLTGDSSANGDRS
jgi:MraZ protein